MIIKIIHQALVENGFVNVANNKATDFYIKESGKAVRFAILHRLGKLVSPDELNTTINQSSPVEFTTDPSFKKNCDLICVHQFNKLADFKKYEEQIFEIEEDPHFYKKYVLYYSDTEVEAVEKIDYESLKELLQDKHQFNLYKDKPTAPTTYSVAAKIFIKLPFLQLPINKADLVPLRLQIEEAVEEKELTKIYSVIKTRSQVNDENLIEELINNELENF